MYWFLSCPTWISSQRTRSNSFRTSLVCTGSLVVVDGVVAAGMLLFVDDVVDIVVAC